MKPDDEIRGLAFDALDLENAQKSLQEERQAAAANTQRLVDKTIGEAIKQTNNATSRLNNHAKGTILGYHCNGFNKVGIYANGFGGTYDQIIQIDSHDCGYDKDFSTAVKKLTVQDRQKLFRG
jgi:hypothetical protein